VHENITASPRGRNPHGSELEQRQSHMSHAQEPFEMTLKVANLSPVDLDITSGCRMNHNLVWRAGKSSAAREYLAGTFREEPDAQ